MRKRLAAWAFALFGAFALAVSCSVHPPVGFRAQADIPFYHYSKTFTTTGNLPTINLTGQSSCVYTITGTGTATPKGSSDGGVTYATISNAGFGAITSGIAGGALIPASGTPISTNFYVAVTGVTGSATATETCSSQVARVSSSGGGGGGVTSLVPGICTSPDPAVGNATLDYICGTPQPLGPGTCTSPAPTTSPPGGIRIDYTCHTPAPQDTTAPTITSTPCNAPPSVDPAYAFHFYVPAGCSSVTPTPFPTPSPVATTTAGPPSAIWTTSAGNPQLSINFPAAGASSAPAGFPWALKQAGTLTKASSATVAGSFGTTATSGDFLLAVIIFNCNGGARTIATPSGWALFGTGLECNTNDNEAIQVFDKTSAGTETGISATASTSTLFAVFLYEFNGARTPDKFAGATSGASGVFSFNFPTLSSPTTGAGVIAVCAVQASAGGTTIDPVTFGVAPWTPWNDVMSTGDNGYLVGFYQGVYGTGFGNGACQRQGSTGSQSLTTVEMSLL